MSELPVHEDPAYHMAASILPPGESETYGQGKDDNSTPEEISRRKFLTKLSIALGGVGAAVVAVPIAGFVVGPLFNQMPVVWRTVGELAKFKVGETVEVKFEDASPLPWAGVAAQTAAWLRREPGDKFTAFTVNCTHLGCPVSWEQNANLFFCPCHGGVYYADGTVAGGPPPHSLPEYPVRVQNGQVQIQAQGIPLSQR